MDHPRTELVLRARRLRRRTAAVSRHPACEKPMIQLHGFAPLWGLSDLSPFVTKVEVYLRLAKLPFEMVPFSPASFLGAPKGKLPYITDGGEKIPDSSFII